MNDSSSNSSLFQVYIFNFTLPNKQKKTLSKYVVHTVKGSQLGIKDVKTSKRGTFPIDHTHLK